MLEIPYPKDDLSQLQGCEVRIVARVALWVRLNPLSTLGH